MRKITLPLTLLAASLSLTACSSLQPKSTPQPHELRPADTLLKVSQEDLQALESPAPNPKPGDFSEDTLFSLLSAEIAGQRNQFDLALNNYLDQARKTRDLNVVIRAVRICQYMKKEPELLEMSELWSELDPKAAEPHHLASLALIRARNYERALFHMEQLINLEGDTNFENLAVHAKTLSQEDREELLHLYQQLLQRHPDNTELLFGYAILQEVNELPADALASLDLLLKKVPDHQAAILMRARVLQAVDGIDPALAYLKKQTQRYPDNRQLGTLYARMLIDNKELDKAQAEFLRLMKRFPDTPGLKLSHALVAMENNQSKLARKELKELLDDGQHTNEANFYLGRMADQEGKTDAAISYYQKVDRGTHFFTALGRAAYLQAQNGQLDQALKSFERASEEMPTQAEQIQQLEINILFELKEYGAALKVVNASLTESPDNTQLLYTRASIHDKLGDVASMEQDLRQILSLEPDNAVAMNALGYILADKTDRHQEAFALIQRALELKPDNPAIMDSMGWVQYRLGNITDAIKWLREAYSKFPDPEVAAHLGEVLWVSGNKDEAMKIWLESLSEHPDTTLVSETMSRLGASANHD